MSETTTTPFGNRVKILSELWMGYRNDEGFQDFCTYNDIGLPLGYCIEAGVVESTPLAETFINETFELLLESLDIEDQGYENLDDLLIMSEG